MIPIIISSVSTVMFLLVLIVTAIVLLVNLARKKQKVKRDLSILIVISLVFFTLIGVDIYLVSSAFAHSKDTVNKVSMNAAEKTGEGLVVTYDAIKKTWDKRSVEKLKNINITITNSSEIINGDNKTYEIKVLFNNKNSAAESMGLDEMIAFNYLVACDKDDIVHPINKKNQETIDLPTGKSEAAFTINVNKDVEITYLRFVDKKITLK